MGRLEKLTPNEKHVLSEYLQQESTVATGIVQVAL